MNEERQSAGENTIQRVTMRDLSRMPEDQLRAVLQSHLDSWVEQGIREILTNEDARIVAHRDAHYVDGLLSWTSAHPRMAPGARGVDRAVVVSMVGAALGDVLGTFDWFRGSAGPNRAARRRAAARARSVVHGRS